MQYPTVVVNGVSVRIDESGRYSLNDLHAAAVANGEATESQRPSVFLRSAQVKRFIKALKAKALKAKALKSASEQKQPLRVTKGGEETGVWGVELLAIRYAAWIKPEFEINMYETFREVMLNGLGNMTRLNRLDLLIANEKQEVSTCARTMNKWGVGGRKNILESTRQNIINQMNPDMVAIMQGTHQ
ncbi:KilA-N domain-containing protein [Salmonella enterica]|nr:KilA-N domain-containing protein [Salmonella enterica]